MGRDDLFPALPFLEHPGGLSEGALIGQGGKALCSADPERGINRFR